VTFGARMRRLPETAAPDVVHIQSPLEPGLPLWALRQLPGVKIGTFHTGGRTSHWGYRWFGRPLRAAARALDGSIAVSREAARYLSTHRLGTQHVIPNGVDFERFAPAHFARAARAGLAPGVFTLLYVGRCDPRKGLETLLDAIARLAADAPGGGPRVRLVVAGDGPCRAALERHARRAQLPVSFAGAVPRALLPHHYAAADAFVAPSRDGESFGISLLEAAAAGLPIVAADIDGYRETLQGSDAALFFPAGSGAALARVLRVLRGDRVRCSRMGASAQRHARRFAWDRIAGEIEAVYRDRLARRAAPRLSRWMRRRPLSVSASSTS
jgi:phosphatidylinositol alpha-mannosyltransferase